MALNEKQEKFAQNYILHRNATEAAKAAGYSKESAYNQGYRLSQNEEVRERILELEQSLETNVDVITEIENNMSLQKQMVILIVLLKLWSYCLELEVIRMRKKLICLLKDWKQLLLRIYKYLVEKK